MKDNESKQDNSTVDQMEVATPPVDYVAFSDEFKANFKFNVDWTLIDKYETDPRLIDEED